MNQPPGYPPGGPPYPGQPGFPQQGQAPQGQAPQQAAKPFQGTQLMPGAPQNPQVAAAQAQAAAAQQAAYGQPPPGYGAPPPQPGYGQPAPGYGQPPAGYGQPQPGYGQPPQAAPGAPPYGVQPPQGGYGQPGQPPAGYGPPPGYAPQAAGYGMVPAQAGGTFGVAEMLSGAWALTKQRWVTLFLANLVVGVVFGVVMAVFFMPSIFLADSDSGQVIAMILMGIGGLAMFGAILFLQGGLTKLWLACARGEQAGVGMVFSGASFIVPFLVMFLLAALVMWVPILNIFLAVGFCLAPFFIVDKKMGAMDALKASWNATKGYRLTTFLVLLIVEAIAIVPIVGGLYALFVAGPLIAMVLGSLYLRLSGAGAPAAAAAAPPAQPWGGAPPAGYGGPPPGGYGNPPAGY